MNSKKSVLIVLPTLAIFAAVVLLAKYWPSEETSTERADVSPQNSNISEDTQTNLANPASVYCEEKGGTVLMQDSAQGVAGICQFDNGSSCDEWDFFHRKCFSEAPVITIDKQATYSATLQTSLGNIGIKLFADSNPVTVNNFFYLASQGFYDNITFHRIIEDFMVQTGDPQGTGQGGPGYTFNDELPVIRPYSRGTVAMANAGSNTNGSQFFIVTQDNDSLPKNYVIFGEVTAGYDVLDKLAAVPVAPGPSGEMSQPLEPPVIEYATIYEAGAEINNRPF